MASLYVGDLHPDVTKAMLFDKFSTAGPVLSIRVCRDMITRRSLGYAYVHFQQPADAERALVTMNFDVIKGRPIRIMSGQRGPSGVGDIFIANLDMSIDNKAMYDTFSAFGNILSCKVAVDMNYVSKGYGFIRFETEEIANKSIEKVNGMLLNGKKIYVEKAGLFTNVYVKNFGEDMTEDQLMDIFVELGRITGLKIMKNNDGTSRAFGFVAFEDPQSAEAAVKELNGKEIIDNKPLYVERAMNRFQTNNSPHWPAHAPQGGANAYTAEMGRFYRAGPRPSNHAGLVRNVAASPQQPPNTQKRPMANQNVNAGPNRPYNYKYTPNMRNPRQAFGIAHIQQAVHVHRAAPRHSHHAGLMSNVNAPTHKPRDMQKPNVANQGGANAYTAEMGRFYRAGPRPSNHAGLVRNVAASPQQPPNTQKRPVANQNVNAGPNRPSNYKYTPNMRNPRQAFGIAHIQQAVHVQDIQGEEPLTAAMLAAAPPQEQKQMLGELLFPLIERTHPDLAAKITGMLLEIDNSELLHMLKHNESLKTKVEEAVALLQAHQQAVHVQGEEPLTAAMLAAAPPQEQKQMLGELLFPLIQRTHPDLAAKITGMLLEIDNSELLHMLEHNESLKAKVEEAVALLQAHQQAVHVQGEEPLTAAMLAAAPPQEQKQMLGELLFPLIERTHPDLAAKITGMLLEIDNSELLHMLEHNESLKAKVEEAVALLQAHQQAVHVQGEEPLTAAMLAAAPPQEQKQMLGELLFPLIERTHPDLAAKITGMLLEIDNSELLHMLEHNESLKAKVEEAVALLQAHQAKQMAMQVKAE